MQDYKKNIKDTANVLSKKAKTRARRNEQEILFNSGVLAVYGSLVCTPILFGLFLGRYLDRHYQMSFSWAFNLTMVGFILGIIFAYRWSMNQGVIRKGEK